MNIPQYIKTVDKRYRSGISSEHSYRADLESLIRELVPSVEITNEPSKLTDCGNPDYVITKKKIPIGYIEAKDIGKDLNGKRLAGDNYTSLGKSVVVVDQSDNEQGFWIRSWGKMARSIEDFEGLLLVRMP